MALTCSHIFGENSRGFTCEDSFQLYGSDYFDSVFNSKYGMSSNLTDGRLKDGLNMQCAILYLVMCKTRHQLKRQPKRHPPA
jgi:hypothetical protein